MARRWEVLFIVVLSSLVLVLINVNYRLVEELHQSGNDDRGGGMDSGVETTAQVERRLESLRSKVDNARDDVNKMKKILKQIKEDQKMGEEYPRLTCTSAVAEKQTKRLNKRFSEWWSHSACPDQVWMEGMYDIFASYDKNDDSTTSSAIDEQPYLILDIGCNKGYASASFLDALSPGTGVNPDSLVKAIRSVAHDTNIKISRDGGVCNDSKRLLNVDRKTVRKVVVHCFEPSPATFNMLQLVHSKLMQGGSSTNDDKDNSGASKWNIHNLGLHYTVGDMAWHPACDKIGDELCGIVPDETKGAITVHVVTVDKFLDDEYSTSSPPIVHVLKIDAEGLDPAVLAGSTTLLSRSGAMILTFEFNPRLSENKDNPHGMWGKGGSPQTELLHVTQWLDTLGYDCYIDSRLVDDGERKKGVPLAPALYRITGNCLTAEPNVRGWANVVCASRKFERVASRLRKLATMV